MLILFVIPECTVNIDDLNHCAICLCCFNGMFFIVFSSPDQQSYVWYCHHFASVVLIIICKLFHFNLLL